MPRPKRYRHIVTAALNTPWAILPAKLDEIMSLLDMRAQGIRLSGREIRDRIGNAAAPNLREESEGGQIAVLNLFGTVFHRADAFTEFSGGTSAIRLGAAFDAALADDAVDSIVINVDSPGGAVPGVQEVADKIFNARGVKPIKAVVNPQAASAAYWIASQAEELIAIPSAVSIGSIGVLSVHTDRSGANEKNGIRRTYVTTVPKKAQYNPDEPLADDDREELQAQNQLIHQTFVEAVGRGRGIDAADVDHRFGAGRTYLASEALARGMIDRIATLDDVLRELGAAAGDVTGDDGGARFSPALACAAAAAADDPRFTPITELLTGR
jgi:signal peptide peptidase SppA